ncbi:MAG: hypothetical protein IPN68_07890 [Bacteroidetes bacterium]|nr:hypothetical protein [Bacteroidota bacterium]
MRRFFCLSLLKLTLLFLFTSEIHALPVLFDKLSSGDSINGNQLLYNGRIWRDLYVAIKGDQFLFTTEFLPGKVTMNGKSFTVSKLKYDILNDEIITVTEKGLVLQLNKEMVDGFTITYKLRDYNFLNLVSDSLSKLDGYFHVMYKGKSALYIMYYKEISKRGPGKNYEDFVQADRVYVIKDDIINQVRNRHDFNKVVADKKHEIKEFMHVNSVKINRKYPDSFVPLLQYYDSLR